MPASSDTSGFMQHKRLPRWYGVAGLALVFVLAGCGAMGDDSARDQRSGVLTTLRVGVDSDNVMTNMPLYVAESKGYFADAGIDEVEITITGDQFVTGLISDSVDISHGSTLSWFAAGAQSGEPLRWIASLRDREFLQLGVRAGIDTPEELVGGRVTGGPVGDENDANLRFILSELGLSESDVEIVPTSPGSDDWLAAVLAGKLDGSMLFARHIQPLEESGGTFLYQEFRAAPQDGFVTTEAFLEENPGTVDAFVLALLKAKQFYKEPANKDEVLRIMEENNLDTSVVAPAYDKEMGQQSLDGGFEIAEMERMVQGALERGQIPADTDWREWVSLEPLWKAQEKLGLPRRPASLD